MITLQISQFFKFFMCAYLSLEPWFPWRNSHQDSLASICG